MRYTIAMIAEDDIRRVREATDIVELISERVVLKQRGREFWGNCPFHNEKTPSFKVDPASQFYHCFGCGEGGDVFKFIMKTENIDFLDAARALAQRKNIELHESHGEGSRGKKARLLAVCEETASYYHQQLMRVKSGEADAARAYLKQREMGGETPRLWQIGFAPGRSKLVAHLRQKGFTRDEMIEANVALVAGTGQGEMRDRFYARIMFPISDLHGRTIAFGGRILGQGEPKYLNSSDTLLFHKKDNLYAIDKAKAAITASGMAIVVEGYTDVIAMHKAGFTQTVATLGTALTSQHLKLLSRFTQRVVLLFDGDAAGQRAADRAVELIGAVAAFTQGSKADLFVAQLTGMMDPADFCANKGSAEMQQVLDDAVPLLRFAIARRLSVWNLEKPEQRTRALEDAVRLLVPVKGTLLAADYINYLADIFAVEYPFVAAALDKAKPLMPGAGVALTDAPARAAANNPSRLSLQAEPALSADKIATLECELLYLFIEHQEVRPRLTEAFSRIVWSSGEHEQVAKALVTLDADEESQSMLAALTAKMPAASSVLARSRLAGFQGVPPQTLVGMLMYSIRERQLKEAIRQESARLRRLNKAQQPDEWDELFNQVAQLQRELSDFRRKYQRE